MTESPTGLWYLIKNEGTGEYLKDNDRITLNYDANFLTELSVIHQMIWDPNRSLSEKPI